MFQIEETITLLAESAEEEGLTPEIEQALAAYLQGVLEKRDRVAEFILRVRGMALRVLDYFGVSKLEGGTHTLTKRKCLASVAIRNRTEISAELKRVTVILPASRWKVLLAALPEEMAE